MTACQDIRLGIRGIELSRVLEMEDDDKPSVGIKYLEIPKELTDWWLLKKDLTPWSE
jgi:uncharacterized membrane protein YcjF (UPF0283 family)